MWVPKRITKYTCALMLFAWLVPSVWPQASTGTVSGTVRDASGGVIPDASITLTNTDTNLESKSFTNAVGFYMYGSVRPGPYRLTVESPGMQKYEATLTVQVAQSAVVNVMMQLGRTAVEVTVTDVTPMMVTDSPTLGHVLERTRIEQLPINGRDLRTLLQTVPGMDGEEGKPTSRAYGLRPGSHEFVLDGSAVSLWNYGETITRLPGLDTIQEFKVENNNSSAKFTRPTTVVIATKGGTSAIHGSAFETHRNNAIGKARRREDVYAKPPPLIRNEFGASAGGPVYMPGLYKGKDRTFWFFAYEGARRIEPSTKGFQVPTEAMRRGDFRGLIDSQGRQYKLYDPWTTDPQTWQREQFSYQGQLNVIDPALISPLAKTLFDITPLPTHPEINPLVDYNWWGPQPWRSREWTISGRLDHRFTENDQVYVRYTIGDWFQVAASANGQAMLNNVAGTVRRLAPNKSGAISWVRTFSPTFFNEFLGSVSREAWWKGTGEPGRKYADELGLPNPFDVIGWPGLYSTGLRNYNFATDSAQASPFLFGIIDDNATKIAGRHELQFGFHYRWDQLNLLPDQQNPQGWHSWSSRATALYNPTSSRKNPRPIPFTGHGMGNMFIGSMGYMNHLTRGYFYVRAKEFAWYFQDNFKVSPRLTVNLGLRYDYWPAFREKNNFLTSFDPDRRAIVLGQDLETMYRLGATFPSIVNRWEDLGAKFITCDQAGLPKGLFTSPKRDFGPRLGFAYRLGQGARSFVLRGGYRISYFRIPARAWQAVMRWNAPLDALLRNTPDGSAWSPDGIPNYTLRTPPTIIAGVNSRDAVTLELASALPRGDADAIYFNKKQPNARVQDWNLTVEKEIMKNTIVRATYVGNHGSNLEQYYEFNNDLTEYIWYRTTREPKPTGEFANVGRRPWNIENDHFVYGGLEEYRMSGWSNFQGMQFEIERRYSDGYGFQFFYNMGNALTAGGQRWYAPPILSHKNYMPGAVPVDIDERNRFLNYGRDTTIPKHRVRWNWIVDVPFGRGKPLGRKVNSVVDKFIGGWQIAGMGNLRSNYFRLPSRSKTGFLREKDIFPNGNPIEIYGYKYPIQDCRGGTCRPGYLWWNGYIPANRINSVDANGKPNGVMGVPANYRPAGQPIWPWPSNPDESDPMYNYYGSNTVWVTLNDGDPLETTYDDNLHGWRNQYFPSVRQWGLDASLFKTIPINERFKIRFNADFFNVLNNPGNLNEVASSGILETRMSGQDARELQLTLRLIW